MFNCGRPVLEYPREPLDGGVNVRGERGEVA
jgi:hypothetical protein